MILVDVRFPELDRTIDFQLNEDVRGWEIAEEISAMAARSCRRSCGHNKNAVLIYSMDQKRQIDLNRTLRENGVCSGERLLYV